MFARQSVTMNEGLTIQSRLMSTQMACRPGAEPFPTLAPGASAFEAFTDFRRDAPLSVDVERRVCNALEEMAHFGVLARKYRGRLLELSLRYMRNRADAEDVVQETFMKACAALDRFRGECQFYTWIRRIAVNSAASAPAARRRIQGRFSPLCPDEIENFKETSTSGTDWDTPERVALTEELCMAVSAAIEALPPEQRTAIALVEFDQLTYSQVAGSMAGPIGSVHSRVFRARDAVDDRLRPLIAGGATVRGGRGRRGSGRSFSE